MQPGQENCNNIIHEERDKQLHKERKVQNEKELSEMKHITEMKHFRHRWEDKVKEIFQKAEQEH